MFLLILNNSIKIFFILIIIFSQLIVAVNYKIRTNSIVTKHDNRLFILLFDLLALKQLKM